jgi:hypothetical protein
MVYLLVLLFLVLAWKWRIRDLIKRLLILAAIPVLHVHFLNKAKNPLVFQAWTLLVLLLLAVYGVYRAVRWVREIRS